MTPAIVGSISEDVMIWHLATVSGIFGQGILICHQWQPDDIHCLHEVLRTTPSLRCDPACYLSSCDGAPSSQEGCVNFMGEEKVWGSTEGQESWSSSHRFGQVPKCCQYRMWWNGTKARTSGVVVSVWGWCGKVVEQVSGSSLASVRHFYFLSGARTELCCDTPSNKGKTWQDSFWKLGGNF